jgi:hypothetical protein
VGVVQQDRAHTSGGNAFNSSDSFYQRNNGEGLWRTGWIRGKNADFYAPSHSSECQAYPLLPMYNSKNAGLAPPPHKKKFPSKKSSDKKISQVPAFHSKLKQEVEKGPFADTARNICTRNLLLLHTK